MKSAGFLRKLQCFFTIFLQDHIWAMEMQYIKPSNATSASKIEWVQYNAALVITEAIWGSSREKLYQELGLEHLHHRRWMKHLCLLYKFLSNKIRKFHLIPPISHPFRNLDSIITFPWSNVHFKNSFFPCLINDWNKLDPKIRNFYSYKLHQTVRKQNLQYSRPGRY